MPTLKVPFPFKMGVFTKDAIDNWSKCSVTIFDCVENPLAHLLPGRDGQPHSGHIELSNFCADALNRLNGVISTLNNDENRTLHGLGYTWIINSVHIDWEYRPERQFTVVFELNNAQVAFDKVFGSSTLNDVVVASGDLTPDIDRWSEVSETLASDDSISLEN
ncbi:hypothetical protein TWF102_008720 [Orbilia oligospora]|uniref:Uncharacterized protein n=1 Tax=Orbilia oligospora TaxID=2813651 RepID=A0A7C8JVV5_ORBOL|nr:hypothetical protein TWF706_002503 [Orbilia oligospora]KAF3091741.1 hypothetical protein TWF102_008720 [Orbilia oligospora]KAF3091879.1 hypothetical protein TWF103_011439 [Orbilia oligospora]KAF3143353.1 hypothetical protein TWF703_010765 [Orbilia oligospora]KAF3143951.1 hypothetical protein TWF594_005017 [Orbilia oligospora]